MKPFPITQIERVSRNFVLMGTLIAGLSAAGLVAGWEEFRGLCFGPDTVTFRELPDHVGRVVRVGAERTIDTGFTHVEGGRALNYVVLAEGEKLLLIKGKSAEGAAGPGRQPPTFVGRLDELPEEQRQKIVGALEVEFPHLKGSFLPYFLEEGGVSAATSGAFCGVLALMMLGLALLYRGARGLEEPLNHLGLRALRRRGAIAAMVEELDRELRTDPKVIRFGNVTLTKSWLVHASRFTFSTVYLPDLAWVYRKRASLFSFESGRAVVFRDTYGDFAEVGESELNTQRIFNEALVRAPWVVTGHNRNLEILWDTDRRSFLEEVKSRRQKGTSAA